MKSGGVHETALPTLAADRSSAANGGFLGFPGAADRSSSLFFAFAAQDEGVVDEWMRNVSWVGLLELKTLGIYTIVRIGPVVVWYLASMFWGRSAG